MPTDSVRKRVLVVGATGRFVELVDMLIAGGHTVRAIPAIPAPVPRRGWVAPARRS